MGPNKTPCDEDAVRELHRIRLFKVGIVNEDEAEEILNWILDFPECVSCRKWVCQCICRL